MSDFDREAERERLREKYERDKEKRETTERMSELLLKGATMTDAHCENCGDPIFRYEGEEFCPTCQQLVRGDAEADDADPGEPEADPGEPEADPGVPGVDPGSPESIEVKRPTGPAADETDANGTESASGEGSDQRDRPETDATGSTASRRPTGRQSNAPAPSPGATTGEGQSGDAFEEARASLTRALRFHAGQAAETADPRRARDHLAAAREAAEALSALY